MDASVPILRCLRRTTTDLHPSTAVHDHRFSSVVTLSVASLSMHPLGGPCERQSFAYLPVERIRAFRKGRPNSIIELWYVDRTEGADRSRRNKKNGNTVDDERRSLFVGPPGRRICLGGPLSHSVKEAAGCFAWDKSERRVCTKSERTMSGKLSEWQN